MRRTLAAALLVPLLAGCSQPIFVPEAGPGAPGYRKQSAPAPPDVEIVQDTGDKRLASSGSIDDVARRDGSFEVTGWAVLDPAAPRGVLRLVLPEDLKAEVLRVKAVPRPDVVAATGNEALLWSGFRYTIRGELPVGLGVCMLSRSNQGAFRLANSDETLCPPP